ncbi:MAG: hypothetical protein IJH37_13010 [Clostridia bacterium]|nr:hypothetical protein [Clostridia bacterium]
MAQTVKIEGLAAAVDDILAVYGTAVTDGIKRAVDDVAKEMSENIKRDAPERTGRYKKAMKLRTLSETSYYRIKQWYVGTPEHRKSHLLERPHRTRSGGKSRAFPHIEKNAEAAEKSLLKKTEEIITNG